MTQNNLVSSKRTNQLEILLLIKLNYLTIEHKGTACATELNRNVFSLFVFFESICILMLCGNCFGVCYNAHYRRW